MQVYVHPSDPEFLGYRKASIFSGATVKNLLPPGSYYASYYLVEAVRSLLAAALQGLTPPTCAVSPKHLHAQLQPA